MGSGLEARHTAVLPNAGRMYRGVATDWPMYKCLSGDKARSKLSAHLALVLGSEDCRVVKLLSNYLLPATDAAECLLQPAAKGKTFLFTHPSVS